MTQPQNQHLQQLNQFGDAQLSELSRRDICASTVHLILTTAFFTGAAIALASQLKTPKSTYLASLREFLENNFGLSAKNAAGMIESNARLYKRYILIENIFNTGRKSVLEGTPETGAKDRSLKGILVQYKELSMSALSIEGIKEQIVVAPKVEPIIQEEPVAPVIIEKPRWGRRLLWVLLIALVALTGYFLVFTQQLPSQLLEYLPAKISDLIATRP